MSHDIEFSISSEEFKALQSVIDRLSPICARLDSPGGPLDGLGEEIAQRLGCLVGDIMRKRDIGISPVNLILMGVTMSAFLSEIGGQVTKKALTSLSEN